MNENFETSLSLATPITCATRRNPHRFAIIKFPIGVISLLLASLSAGNAFQSVSLGWNRNSETNIASYRLYYGTQSGGQSQFVDAGNVTSATVPNLSDSTTYFFTVKAVNTAGLQSQLSNEVSHKTANPAALALTVNEGSGSGNYVAGTIVPVNANAAPAGKTFERWVDDWVILSNPMIAKTTATMPSQDVAITATYLDLPRFALTVNKGTGSGTYSTGTQVQVTADAAPAGQQFVSWTGNVGALASSTSPTTTVTMPSSAVAITAGYSTILTLKSLWAATTIPKVVDGGADSPVELGLKFRSDVAGKIKGIRFYKFVTNTGIHVGNLWSNTGTLLATATFVSETASGWQQVNFATPVQIAANTFYVASYHAKSGHYSCDMNYFASAGVDNPPLHTLRSSTANLNGVYAYGAKSAFPKQSWNSSNYWVDVVFEY